MRRLVNLLASNNLLLRVVSYGRQHGRGGGSGEAKQEATRDRCFRPDGVIRLAKHLARRDRRVRQCRGGARPR